MVASPGTCPLCGSADVTVSREGEDHELRPTALAPSWGETSAARILSRHPAPGRLLEVGCVSDIFLPPSSFDAVTRWDALPHVPSPRPLMGRAGSLHHGADGG